MYFPTNAIIQLYQRNKDEVGARAKLINLKTMSQANNNGNNNIGAARSILEVQQQFAESLGYGSEIIWDL